MQEAVALEADVDEGGLHAGQDVVDLALVDVADDRAPAAALDVELGDRSSSPALVVFDSSTATRVSPRSADTRIVFFIRVSATRVSAGVDAIRRICFFKMAHLTERDLPSLAESRAWTWMLCRSPIARKVASTDEPP